MVLENREKIFVIGGCRSGKSSHALELAEGMHAIKKTFIATCVPRDAEMEERVLRHQKERKKDWHTLEIAVDIADAVIEQSQDTDLILVDCLTLWISNLMLETDDLEVIREKIEKLSDAVLQASCSVILVSNEVGTGIVPENRLARMFRDCAGWTNQAMARACDTVFMTVAGIAVQIKPSNMFNGQ